jgi:uncharacterized membrane protein
MLILIVGLLLWAFVHWFPVAMPANRAALINRLGEGPYKAVFSILSFAAIGLMVLGWKQAPLVKVYVPPFFGNWIIGASIAIAIILFFAPYIPNNLRRLLRHPQLTGVVLWSAAHLLVNGTARDLVLFGGLATWALASMLFANKRDGAWQRPAPAPIWMDGVLVAFGLLVAGGLFHFHGRLFGVTPIYFG